jgi:hypothetical protein
MNLMRDFTKIDKGLIDNTELDDINQEIEEHIKTLYVKRFFKEKAKIRFNLQKTLKNLEQNQISS